MTALSKKPRPTRVGIAPIIPLDKPGRLRLVNLMALFSISHQTVYQRIKDGQLPPPDGYDGRRPYWNTGTILAALGGC
jgi:predicted DNA-binding transcriptional regulator AlpA